ncbi:MAG: ABC transporter substrate-binding protein, partial [Syntrophales bacterium]|nr:ABC transporter substrate-binding protein [Syntrophales bacterium]
MRRSAVIKVCIHLIFLAMIVALAACGPREQPAVKPRPLKIGWSAWTGWYPMAIAAERQLFAKHGVDVQPIFYQNYLEVLADLGSGKIDGAFCGLYEALKANIPDVKVVLITDYSDGAEGLVVTPDIRTPRDLKGKRVGIQGALSGSEFLVTTYLRRHNMPPKEITFVNVPPDEVLARMPRDIQGGYTWDPFLSQARARGYRLLFTTADMKGLVFDVVAFHGAVTKSRGDQIRRFITAWFEAQRYWEENPDGAAGIIARVTGLKKEEITREGYRFFSLQDNQQAGQPGNDFRSIYHT